ncbi:coniferyl aldehyde dehydrogenase [Paraferrimonas sp. SM1919]|uniref:coniferyl aldehyde dehydrogenase n=1 Tax=Paraferrimonas sp. SM1919 TaxID=2662263 RepID=UPI0013D72BEA|nr:coniferyl aldehyde dehydrogenase [Paraferrimonas sp. SM1919]
MALNAVKTTEVVHSSLEKVLQKQQQAFRETPYPALHSRRQKLESLKQAILINKDNLTAALSNDFGHRSVHDSMFTDIMPSILNINYILKNLKKWLKPSKRHSGLMLSPAKVEVQYQPLGVVGIIVPWNFPLNLSLNPLATALAAGNRVMLKMSEFTPSTNAVVKKMLAETFGEDEVCIIEGEAEVAAEFSSLPFDHLLFTGSTTVGKHVMRAAADNLTPVTLELGGKSPSLITPDMDIVTAAKRLAYGKCLNAGQICVAPDYVLLPENKKQPFIEAYIATFNQMYPDFVNNDDYTHIINDKQHQRLQSWLADAKAKGAKVFSAAPEALSGRKMATQLLTNVTDDMQVMQEEIFGPLLPIIGYDSIEQAIQYVNARPRPLALYIFGFDNAQNQMICQQTHSGGVAINDTVVHVAADDAPFGGIGPSGMGHYHGHEGFQTFSKAKTVLKQGRFNSTRFVYPPYDTWLQKMLLKVFVR